MISVILPTVRPHLVNQCVESIIKAGIGVDLEIVIVSDFLKSSASIIKEQELRIKNVESPRKGVVDANIIGYENAIGSYIMTISDEASLYPGSLKALQKFCEARDNKVLTSPTHIPYFNFRYYNKWFAPFPFAHRSLIESCGGLFLPEYKCFYADPDLSLRAYEHGFQVKECPDAVIHHPNDMGCPAHKDNVSAYVEADREVFKKKWAHLGEFKDP